MSQTLFVEGLESRLFLSASTAAGVFNATVRADRLVVQADLLKFRSDALSSAAKLLLDLNAIKRNVAAGDTSLTGPFQTLKSDNATLRTTLREERLTESADALADESAIKLDLRQILKDKGNTTALAADRTQLRNDRVKLQNDLLAGLDARIATRQSAETTIANDTQAIVDAANNDSQATQALKDAASTFAADRTARLAALTADLQTIAAARTTLANDLTAEQSS